MFSTMLLKCLVAFMVVGASPVLATAEEDATKEVISVLEDPKQYNNDVMPFNESGPVYVRLQMYLRNIDVSDEDMTSTVEMTFRMLWNDERLAYSTPDVDYVNIIDTHKLWLPDAFFKNAIETEQMKSVHPEAYARVTPEGDITYSTRIRLVLRCNMDLTRFPHDDQSCPILIASYGYSADHIVFEMDKDIDTVEDLIYNSRFEVGDFETLSCDTTTKTGTYSCIEVDMTLERVSSTYSMEFYIPFIFLVIVAFFSEIIPAGALLPRLLLTLGPLITLASFYFAYSLSLPAVSYARASDIFAGISMLVNFALLIHTIVAYYRSLLDIAEKKRRDAEGVEGIDGEIKDVENQKSSDVNTENMTKMELLRHKISVKFDYIYRLSLIIFYVAFLFFYFAAYNM